MRLTKFGVLGMLMLLMLCFLQGTAMAEEAGIWQYEKMFNGTARITGCFDTTATVIEIPRYVNGLSVIGITHNVFYENDRIEEFHVEEGHPSFAVVDGMLMNKKGTQVIAYPSARKATLCTIPEGVQKILPHAFYNCATLRRIDIPGTVEQIGMSGFYGSGIETLELPDSVLRIGDCAFCYCAHLETAKLPVRIERIGACAFDNCFSLRAIEIPDGVTEIGGLAFNNCFALEEVRLPESLKTIGICAFGYCASIETLVLPDGLELIDDLAFAACTGLMELTVPSSVSRIGGLAFNNCTKLQYVSVPAAVHEIGENAFANCSKVQLGVERNSIAEEYAVQNRLAYRFLK